MGNSSQTRVKVIISKTVPWEMWKWGKGNNESGLRRRKSWNGNRQWQVGRGERAKHWVGDSRWPMTWTDKPTSSTSTLPTSFFLHWRKSRQRLFWEIQTANIDINKKTTNICELLYLACILWMIYTHRFYFWHRTGQGLPLEKKTNWINVVSLLYLVN